MVARMRRWIIVLTALFVASGLAVTAVTVAGAGSGSSDRERARDGASPARFGGDRPRDRARFRGGGRLGFGPFAFGPARAVFRGVADKLDVTPKRLREALRGVKRRRLDRVVQEGTITTAERDALAACLERRGGGRRRGESCDAGAARAAMGKLKAAKRAQGRDLTKLKAQLLADLAAELDKPEADVAAAIRASLVGALDKAVARGWLTERGGDLATGCFDTPASCDRKALRGELRRSFGGGGGGPGKRRG